MDVKKPFHIYTLHSAASVADNSEEVVNSDVCTADRLASIQL